MAYNSKSLKKLLVLLRRLKLFLLSLLHSVDLSIDMHVHSRSISLDIQHIFIAYEWKAL